MTLVHSVMVSFQRPYDVIRVAPFVIRVADTGSLYNSIIRVAPSCILKKASSVLSLNIRWRRENFVNNLRYKICGKVKNPSSKVEAGRYRRKT
ncbi:hypothetical protein NMD99_02185 [Wolbachia endosymbiont of Listronotus oregonensis]|uniref:hypothetical protein n=1 Tax=Wolbachia endosymbiont of Listronotus oregonensis TaxID=2969106 RepID=UPI0028165A47|nr:hypothetical protein [Wolbachia endosymbiont of Listronotus oregonensis]WMT84821.1 hypothetical protein NMD99_02185 [Wolbachia endosymbiont of Listronotus oregonensis]